MPLRAVRVRGPYKGSSGYDHVVREFVRALVKQGVAVELIDFSEWGPNKLPVQLEDPWFDSLNRPTGARLALHFCMPHQVKPDPGFHNVNYTMFEATRIHPTWVAASRQHDLVILPTESSWQAWVSSGVSAERIRLCPLGINPEYFTASVRPLPLRRDDGEPIGQYRRRFLNVSELGPRKNLIGLLRVWLRATSAADDAILVLKLRDHGRSHFEELRVQIAQLEAQLGKRLTEAAPVQLIHGLYADIEMPRLYASSTHYVSLSHGEGWDQPMFEAAAMGLKLIAPEHSAYLAYLDRSVAQLIPSREVPAALPRGGDIGPLFDGANWWDPDEDAAVAILQAAIQGRDSATASPRERILRDLTWEKAAGRLIEILSEVEARKTRGVFGLLSRLSKRD